MLVIKMFRVDDWSSEYDLILGDNFIGRNFLHTEDEEILFQHCTIRVSSNTEVYLKAGPTKPCYHIKDGNRYEIGVNQEAQINKGEKFSLLPDTFVFEILITETERIVLSSGYDFGRILPVWMIRYQCTNIIKTYANKRPKKESSKGVKRKEIFDYFESLPSTSTKLQKCDDVDETSMTFETRNELEEKPIEVDSCEELNGEPVEMLDATKVEDYSEMCFDHLGESGGVESADETNNNDDADYNSAVAEVEILKQVTSAVKICEDMYISSSSSSSFASTSSSSSSSYYLLSSSTASSSSSEASTDEEGKNDFSFKGVSFADLFGFLSSDKKNDDFNRLSLLKGAVADGKRLYSQTTNDAEWNIPSTSKDGNFVEVNEPSTSKKGIDKENEVAYLDEYSESDEDEMEEENEVQDAREPCVYGAKCYRKSASHYENKSHPGDKDYRDNRPECPYGTSCYGRNESHEKKYKHTAHPSRRLKRNNVVVNFFPEANDSENSNESVREVENLAPESDSDSSMDLSDSSEDAAMMNLWKKRRHGRHM